MRSGGLGEIDMGFSWLWYGGKTLNTPGWFPWVETDFPDSVVALDNTPRERKQ